MTILKLTKVAWKTISLRYHIIIDIQSQRFIHISAQVYRIMKLCSYICYPNFYTRLLSRSSNLDTNNEITFYLIICLPNNSPDKKK